MGVSANNKIPINAIKPVVNHEVFELEQDHTDMDVEQNIDQELELSNEGTMEAKHDKLDALTRTKFDNITKILRSQATWNLDTIYKMIKYNAVDNCKITVP